MFPRWLRLLASILIGLVLAAGVVGSLSGSWFTVHIRASGPLYVALMGSDAGNDCQNALNPCASLQRAVDVAVSGDEIRIAGGTYTGVQSRASYTQHAYISQTVIVRGGYTTTDGFAISDPLQNPTILDAQGTGRVILITGTAGVLENLTVTGGYIGLGGVYCCGGGIYANETLRLGNVNVISNVSANLGGGVYARGELLLEGGVFQENSAEYSGGGVFAWDLLLVTQTHFMSNTAPHAGSGTGGAISAEGLVILISSTFQNNVASSEGGGVHAYNGVILTDTIFMSNTAGSGGGLLTHDWVIITKGLFQGNRANGGGGLYAETGAYITNTQFVDNSAYNSNGGGALIGGSFFLQGGLFQDNSALWYGGGLTGGRGVVTGTQFLSNTAGQGGGAYMTGPDFDIEAVLFQGNTALYRGGGLLIVNATLTNVAFISNTASTEGGGLYVHNGKLQGGLFQGNVVTNGHGGGMAVSSDLVLTDTAFLDNYSSGDGAGLYFMPSASDISTLTNVLMARNEAGGEGDGLYVELSFIYPPCTVNIIHATIASPTISDGSAIYVTSNTVNITNTIIASYTTGIELISGTVNEDYNLFFGLSAPLTGAVTSGGHSLVGDPVFLNPSLDDYHILSNSLALEAGFDLGVTSDFEGDPRPQGLAPDIGYDEFPLMLPNRFKWYLPFVTRQTAIFWGPGSEE